MGKIRFGAQLTHAKSRQDLQDFVTRTEDSGFDLFASPDHFTGIDLAITPLLASVAQMSSRLEIASLVYDNDFRHPLLLAREAATLQVLSEGRFTCGIGAGWFQGEYQAVGLPWDSPGERIARLEEALVLIKSAWKGEAFSHEGRFYQVKDYTGLPRMESPPRLMLGAGGKRMLALAGREADVVNLIPPLDRGFGSDMRKFTNDQLSGMIETVRQAAGGRALELSIDVFFGGVTDRPEEELARTSASQGYTPEQARLSPHYMFGSAAQIQERVLELHQRFGISLFCFSQFGCDLDSLGPVLAGLRPAGGAGKASEPT